MADVVKHVGTESTRLLTTLYTEITLSTLRDHAGLGAECCKVCSKEHLWREAGEMERSTPLKETIENDVDRERSTKDVSGRDGRTGW